MTIDAKFRRSCKCGNVDFFSVSNREAAFGIIKKDISSSHCSKCGNNRFNLLNPINFTINEDIIREWSLNEELCFDYYGYDDYIISNAFLPINLILNFIDDNNTLYIKKGVLISSVFIWLNEDQKKKNEKEFNEIITALKSRRKLVEEHLNFISPENKLELISLID